MNRVSFCSTPNYCELTTESAQNCWSIRFYSDGKQEMFRNGLQVHFFAKSPLCALLVHTADRLEKDILDYMNAKDTLVGSQTFWRIRESLEEGEPCKNNS